MTRTKLIIKFSAAAALILATWGCGTSNDQAPSLNSSGKHPPDWVSGHRVAYSRAYAIDNARQCRDCHGIDLTGGIAGVGCSTTSCHAGGHPPRPIPHTVPFQDPSVHGPVAKADLIYCQTCHGQPGGAGSNPRFNLGIGTLAKGCSSNGCHNRSTPTQFRYTSAAHPIPWNGHASAGNLSNACALCHGVLLSGGVGRGCSSCHTGLAVGAIPVAGQCSSCHGKPPSGSTFPNISGAHRKHGSLVTGSSDNCSNCHDGSGSGTPTHSTLSRAPVAFPASMRARSGSASYNLSSQSCTGTICHGGLATPAWRQGRINKATQCLLCHTAGTSSQSPQYNSYYSGEHNRHVNSIGLPCTDCHDMNVTSGSNSHFSGLATPAFELAPSFTIRNPVNYSGGRCAPGNNPSQFTLGVCHGTESW